VGHIGSALSIADILTSLYSGTLRIESPNDPERDRFILSKGHAALALYAALFLKGWISDEQLNTYCGDGTLLGTHPESGLPGVDFASGSLGQGLSLGVGSALAARLQHSRRRVFVLLSDAECNEGSIWEAVMFAAHHHLANLVVIVDANSQQALGYTRDVLDLSPLEAKWAAFNWDVRDVDGNNVEDLVRVLGTLDMKTGQPHVLVASTVFGKGVSFMEHQISWHYLPLSDSQCEQALLEIARSG
jgi:transketolase